MERRGERYVMRTRDREGALADYNASWVIGGKRMQDAVTVFDDGRWQVCSRNVVLDVAVVIVCHGALVPFHQQSARRVRGSGPSVTARCREPHANSSVNVVTRSTATRVPEPV